MGFDVTAAHVIFFAAILTAVSAAMGAFWKGSSDLSDARRDEAGRVERVIHSNLTLSGVSYNQGTDRFSFTVNNAGTVTMNVSAFVYIVDGAYNASVESASVSGASGSQLLLPGDTLQVQLRPIAASPSYLAVVADNGFRVYWRG